MCYVHISISHLVFPLTYDTCHAGNDILIFFMYVFVKDCMVTLGYNETLHTSSPIITPEFLEKLDFVLNTNNGGLEPSRVCADTNEIDIRCYYDNASCILSTFFFIVNI